jgi:Xaa-Pro dipeptidase
MSNEELERARNELRKLGVDWVLLSSRENVTYVSHFETPTEFGFYADLAYAPPICLFGVKQAGSTLLVQHFYESWVKDRQAIDEVVPHVILDPAAPAIAQDNFLATLRKALGSAGLASGTARLAIEEKSLPASVLLMLQQEFPGLDLVEAEPALKAARLLKTEREILLLREAAEVNKVGQTEFMQQCRVAGKNEFYIWGAAMQSMQRAARKQIDFNAEVILGPGVANFEAGPRDLPSRAGDMATLDSTIRVNGYFSDTTNTVLVGEVEPTARQKLYGVAAREAFYAAADALRPGRRACDAFVAANAALEKHGLTLIHHAGHQIGTTCNEEPRLLPYDTTPIQPGMVFSVEPGAYEGPGGTIGARMEKQVIVHETGPEIFPDFEWGF